MTRKFLVAIVALMTFCVGVDAISITRYVAAGATGDGLSKENPSGDLLKVLRLSTQVDGLTVYLAPGTYNLPPRESADDYEKFRQVSLYGGWSFSENKQTEERSVITGNLYVNGGLVSGIDFRGNKAGNKVEGYLQGELVALGCNVYNSTVSRLTMQVVGNSVSYLCGVTAQSASVSPQFTGMRGAVVSVADCHFENGEGLHANDVVLKIQDCIFEGNKNVALGLYHCEGTEVVNCRFRRNNNAGAVKINDLTDNFSVIFRRCAFSDNITMEEDYASAITTNAPIYMENCMIAGNESGVGKNINGKHLGALELSRRASLFVNCTLYGNKDAAVYYDMMPADHSKITKAQFYNCVFLNNRLSSICPYGNGPLLYMCAADFGSDIPELNAEKKLLRIDGKTAKMSVLSNDDYFLCEGSPLINAGDTRFANDMFDFSHVLFGGTDLGCVEYFGKWKKSVPEKSVTIGKVKYVGAESSYDGKNYYFMVEEDDVKEDGSALIKGGLYLGDNLAPVKVLDEAHAITYMTADGLKAAVLNQYDSKAWRVVEVMPYTASVPLAVKNANGTWKLKIGGAPAKKPQPKKVPVRRR